MKRWGFYPNYILCDMIWCNELDNMHNRHTASDPAWDHIQKLLRESFLVYIMYVVNYWTYMHIKFLLYDLWFRNPLYRQSLQFIYFQSTFRPNRGNVTGYFLAGKTMHWIPVGSIPDIVILQSKTLKENNTYTTI